MAILIFGLVVFLGVHSVRIVADDWRSAQIALRGERSLEAGLYRRIAGWLRAAALGFRPGAP